MGARVRASRRRWGTTTGPLQTESREIEIIMQHLNSIGRSSLRERKFSTWSDKPVRFLPDKENLCPVRVENRPRFRPASINDNRLKTPSGKGRLTGGCPADDRGFDGTFPSRTFGGLRPSRSDEIFPLLAAYTVHSIALNRPEIPYRIAFRRGNQRPFLAHLHSASRPKTPVRIPRWRRKSIEQVSRVSWGVVV